MSLVMMDRQWFKKYVGYERAAEMRKWCNEHHIRYLKARDGSPIVFAEHLAEAGYINQPIAEMTKEPFKPNLDAVKRYNAKKKK